jgi:hypothetical protein
MASTATWTIVSTRDMGTTARFQSVETGLSTTFMEMKCAMGWAMLPPMEEAEVVVRVTVVEAWVRRGESYPSTLRQLSIACLRGLHSAK